MTVWYELTGLRIKQIRRPSGYLATARINGARVERFYYFKPIQQQVFDDLIDQYTMQQHARVVYQAAAAGYQIV